MARIDQLISQINDDRLRSEPRRSAQDLRKAQKFGLVFEEHLPETILVGQTEIAPGSIVCLRKEPKSNRRYRVLEINGSRAKVADDGHEPIEVEIDDLLLVTLLGEPVYPALEDAGQLVRFSSAGLPSRSRSWGEPLGSRHHHVRN